jgi:hypothetical protein
MRITDLRVMAITEEYLEEHEGEIFLAQIVLIQLKDGRLTWRGLGQIVPKSKLLGTAVVMGKYRNDGFGFMAIDLCDGSPSLSRLGWNSMPFEPHEMILKLDAEGNPWLVEFKALKA